MVDMVGGQIRCVCVQNRNVDEIYEIWIKKCRKSGGMREPKGQADEMRRLNRPLQAKTDGAGLLSRA